MNPQRLATIRTTLRPALRQTTRNGQIRLSSTHNPGTPQGPHVGDKGTAKVYNKDGTNPNKNFAYLGAAVVGLGGTYFFFGGRRTTAKIPAADKVA
ncbi:hypothetical protein QBC44DRAFT_128810 [Cladorrhinum sp. PSN332]|nr:hypothetical protein QBC44DRAFT_128810 [Cladorrhinum sp. PSN332]